MKTLLIIIMVANGRIYHETPVYAVEYPDEQQCMTAAAKYATSGTNYEKAMCIPKFVKVEVKSNTLTIGGQK